MRERFEDPRTKNKYLKNKTLATIERANIILNDMTGKGYTLTLRQLFYQFVKRNWLPNEQRIYKQLSETISAGRLFGLIDWSAIEDRGRFVRSFGDFDNPADYLKNAHRGYAENIWRDQPCYCEVWVEKDALIGVVERPCERWRVPYVALRGYNSQSECYLAGKRLEYQRYELGKRVVVFHLGDHDPSGQDMTRDNESRLQVFSRDSDFQFHRLALNMDQVRKYNPPPNPAKESDSRYAAYVSRFGTKCWELDALEPEDLDALVNDAITELVDTEKFEAALLHEKQMRNQIKHTLADYETLTRFVEQGGGTDNGFIEGMNFDE